ncbi:MAG: ABC transporter substrate-binding protein [Candidatus Rokubacteria bacterium]|nr:ABC transporter substrate-binding protein [Candidatus Rokubacteria bacterium]
MRDGLDWRRGRIVRIGSGLAVAGILIAFTSIPSTSEAADTLKIGVLGPLSGAAAPWGIALSRGAELRAEELNAAGGLKIAGKAYILKTIPYDHKATAAEAATTTNKLVFEDKVKFIVGNAVGATCDAAQAITEREKVLFTFVCWGTKNVAADKPYSFRELLSQWEVSPPLYAWIREKHPKIRRVALISPNDTSGWDTSTAVKDAAKELGMEVVADEYYERGAKDFYPLLTKILAKKPDLLELAGSTPGEGGLILKQAYELGYRGGKAWVAAFDPTRYIQIAGKEATEGLWTVGAPDLEGTYVSPGVKEFARKYRGKYGEPATMIAVANYAGMDVVTKAMQMAGSLDPDKVLQALVKGKFETVWGPVVIGGKARYGIDRQFLYPFVISEIRDGKTVDISSVAPKELKK